MTFHRHLALGLAAFALLLAAPPRIAHNASAPDVAQSIVATYVAGEVSLTGAGLGAPGDARSIAITSGGIQTDIDDTSPAVLSWSDTAIDLRLPPAVHSGEITVTVDGATSTAVPLRVFEYTSMPVPASANSVALPLALAVDANGTLWLNEEYHRELKWFTHDDPPATTTKLIPQVDSPGIFAAATPGDHRTPLSVLGEDITVASDGSIWFTEGGELLYEGVNDNTSRVVRYDPRAGAFSCFNIPQDNAQVTGLAVDAARGVVYYAESALFDGNAIGSFRPADVTSDCSWTPETGTRAPVCGEQPVLGCHTIVDLPQPISAPMQITLDPAGSVWFTEYWANRIGHLDPATGVIDEFPLPPPTVRSGPGIYAGSGPFELAFDPAGDLWIAEEFDGAISRLRPSLAATLDCTRLGAGDKNPCIEEVYRASNGSDGVTTHTISAGADGAMWFGVSDASGHGTRVGFIDTARDDAVVLLPAMPDVQNIAGIVQDPARGDVWFSEFSDRRIGRLQIATGDADGIPTATDNCPDAYNPGQQNADSNFVDLPANRPYDDLTWPNSDGIGDACDPDMDNDGLASDLETALPGPACPTASGPTDPLLRDSDGDMVLDGAECRLGSDPLQASSYPPRAPGDDPDRDQLTTAFERSIGTDPYRADSDGDWLNDGAEIKNYNTNPLSKDTDGDNCGDGREAYSVNADRWVNVIDQLLVAVSTGGSHKYALPYDLNKDGAINPGDMGLAATSYGPC